MLIEGLVGLALILAATVFVTRFVLEVMHTPVISDDEWEVQRCTRAAPHICADNGPCNGWPKDGD
jgi:hypothetical protein